MVNLKKSGLDLLPEGQHRLQPTWAKAEHDSKELQPSKHDQRDLA